MSGLVVVFVCVVLHLGLCLMCLYVCCCMFVVYAPYPAQHIPQPPARHTNQSNFIYIPATHSASNSYRRQNSQQPHPHQHSNSTHRTITQPFHTERSPTHIDCISKSANTNCIHKSSTDNHTHTHTHRHTRARPQSTLTHTYT